MVSHPHRLAQHGCASVDPRTVIGVWIIDIVPTHALCLSCPLLALLLLVLLVLLPLCERERSSSLVLARYRACGWSLSVSAGVLHTGQVSSYRESPPAAHCIVHRRHRETVQRETDSTDSLTLERCPLTVDSVDLDRFAEDLRNF